MEKFKYFGVSGYRIWSYKESLKMPVLVHFLFEQVVIKLE